MKQCEVSVLRRICFKFSTKFKRFLVCLIIRKFEWRMKIAFERREKERRSAIEWVKKKWNGEKIWIRSRQRFYFQWLHFSKLNSRIFHISTQTSFQKSSNSWQSEVESKTVNSVKGLMRISNLSLCHQLRAKWRCSSNDKVSTYKEKQKRDVSKAFEQTHLSDIIICAWNLSNCVLFPSQSI